MDGGQRLTPTPEDCYPRRSTFPTPLMNTTGDGEAKSGEDNVQEEASCPSEQSERSAWSLWGHWSEDGQGSLEGSEHGQVLS